ncbi:MAG: 2-hydroxyacid dehydrogenase [Shimia sp.]
MRDLFDAELRTDDAPWDAADLADAVARAEVLVPTVTDRIDAALIDGAGPGLRLIANYGAGVDHIDLGAARARGIMVANTPAPVTEDTADMTLALILAVTRRVPEGLALMQSGDWAGWAPTAMLGGRLGGRMLGILGMGRIGRAVARRATAFGMRIAYHQRHRLRPETEAELGAVWYESLDQMVAQADVLSLHCPRTPGTYHLLNARRIALMKPTGVVVNTSRADVVDENALTRALRSGAIAGAGLDVHEQGHGINPRLRALPNVVLLPHMGSATHEARHEMGEAVCLNIQTFRDGHRPPYLVLPDVI